MYSFETQKRVRYAETDQMGYVYYGNYALYYEIARTEAFRDLGFPYKNLEDEGLMMPVREMQTRYLQAAKYDDLLTLKVIIPEMPKVKIFFEYEIYNEAQNLLNTGNTTLVFIEKDTFKLKKCPSHLQKLFESYFSSSNE